MNTGTFLSTANHITLHSLPPTSNSAPPIKNVLKCNYTFNLAFGHGSQEGLICNPATKEIYYGASARTIQGKGHHLLNPKFWVDYYGKGWLHLSDPPAKTTKIELLTKPNSSIFPANKTILLPRGSQFYLLDETGHDAFDTGRPAKYLVANPKQYPVMDFVVGGLFFVGAWTLLDAAFDPLQQVIMEHKKPDWEEWRSNRGPSAINTLAIYLQAEALGRFGRVNNPWPAAQGIYIGTSIRELPEANKPFGLYSGAANMTGFLGAMKLIQKLAYKNPTVANPLAQSLLTWAGGYAGGMLTMELANSFAQKCPVVTDVLSHPIAYSLVNDISFALDPIFPAYYLDKMGLPKTDPGDLVRNGTNIVVPSLAYRYGLKPLLKIIPASAKGLLPRAGIYTASFNLASTATTYLTCKHFGMSDDNYNFYHRATTMMQDSGIHKTLNSLTYGIERIIYGQLLTDTAIANSFWCDKVSEQDRMLQNSFAILNYMIQEGFIMEKDLIEVLAKHRLRSTDGQALKEAAFPPAHLIYDMETNPLLPEGDSQENINDNRALQWYLLLDVSSGRIRQDILTVLREITDLGISRYKTQMDEACRKEIETACRMLKDNLEENRKSVEEAFRFDFDRLDEKGQREFLDFARNNYSLDIFASRESYTRGKFFTYIYAELQAQKDYPDLQGKSKDNLVNNYIRSLKALSVPCYENLPEEEKSYFRLYLESKGLELTGYREGEKFLTTYTSLLMEREQKNIQTSIRDVYRQKMEKLDGLELFHWELPKKRSARPHPTNMPHYPPSHIECGVNGSEMFAQ